MAEQFTKQEQELLTTFAQGVVDDHGNKWVSVREAVEQNTLSGEDLADLMDLVDEYLTTSPDEDVQEQWAPILRKLRGITSV